MRSSVYSIPPIDVEETRTGSEGIVDLWYYFYEDTLCTAALAVPMSKEEQVRFARLHFEKDRQLFTATRALVRTVLSQYVPVAPGDWCFGASDFGKPHISFPRVNPHLHFNLSNTPSLIVCAVSVAHERVGVDVERIDQRFRLVEIADEYFSPSEIRAMGALPRAEQPLRFFTYWTLKESYIKARGLGLALPLDHFSFSLDGNAINVAFDARLADDATRWQFATLDAPPDYMIAVGVDTGGAPLSLRAMPIVPFADK